MYISGTGITTPIRVEIDQTFRPDTMLALNWVQCSSGKWVATDRGATADVYKTTIDVTGYESTINNLILALYTNRTAGSNVVALSGFTSTEDIFGSDVDHTGSINATVLTVTDRRQVTLRNFGISIELQAIAPTFLGSPGSLVFRNFDFEYDGYSESTIKKYDTYNGTFSYQDRAADTGIFKGIAYLSNDNMRIFRRALATQRGSAITTTVMSGVNNIFGPTRTNSWPRNLKYLEANELGYWGLNYHKVRIKAVEDI